MSRSRKVEHEDALGAATALFWTHGYYNLGTRQIEEETGITRFTLQTSYGGKMKLYLTALDAYLDAFERSDLIANLTEGLTGIARFFETRGTPDAMSDSSYQGCFMLNSMIEFSSTSSEINLRADRYFAILRNGFRAGLQRADDETVSDNNVDQKTEILLSAALGLNAIIRADGNYKSGTKMATAIAVLVKGWANPAG